MQGFPGPLGEVWEWCSRGYYKATGYRSWTRFQRPGKVKVWIFHSVCVLLNSNYNNESSYLTKCQSGFTVVYELVQVQLHCKLLPTYIIKEDCNAQCCSFFLCSRCYHIITRPFLPSYLDADGHSYDVFRLDFRERLSHTFWLIVCNVLFLALSVDVCGSCLCPWKLLLIESTVIKRISSLCYKPY